LSEDVERTEGGRRRGAGRPFGTTNKVNVRELISDEELGELWTFDEIDREMQRWNLAMSLGRVDGGKVEHATRGLRAQYDITKEHQEFLKLQKRVAELELLVAKLQENREENNGVRGNSQNSQPIATASTDT